MAINPFHILTEGGNYILTEDGLSHILLEDATSLEHEIGGESPVEQFIDYHDGWSKASKDFRQRQKKEDRDLADIVAKIFDEVSPVDTPTPQEKKTIATRVAAAAESEGIATKLAAINALITKYERAIKKFNDDASEEAIIMLLLSS